MIYLFDAKKRTTGIIIADNEEQALDKLSTTNLIGYDILLIPFINMNREVASLKEIREFIDQKIKRGSQKHEKTIK